MFLLRSEYSTWKTTTKFVLQTLKSSDQRRHILSWLRSLEPSYCLNSGTPWLTYDAIDYLSNYLHPGMKVFEYGSGCSTVFWGSHHVLCTSIEHNPNWYERVRERLLSASWLDLRLIEPEESPLSTISPNWADPAAYRSSDPEFQGFTFRNYVSQIDEFPDEHFDVVLIDGRARPSCLMHSIVKLKRGGVIVLDNADREHYLKNTQILLGQFQQFQLIGVTPLAPWYTRTDIFVRHK